MTAHAPRPADCFPDNARHSDQCADRAVRQRNEDDLAAYIEEIIENAPPLTSEQRDKLALLLRSPRRTR